MEPSVVVAAAAAVVQCLAFCIGGAWVLYNFGLQRIRKPVVQLSMEVAEQHRRTKGVDLHLRIEATNTGRTGVAQEFCWLEVWPLSPPKDGSDAITVVQPSTKESPRRYGIFQFHSFLEPSETFTDVVLVQVPCIHEFVVLRAVFSAARPRIEVISVGDVSVLELGEYECCLGDVADFGWAGGDVLEGAPAADQEGEAAFAEAA
jgi:hypothetical protein